MKWFALSLLGFGLGMATPSLAQDSLQVGYNWAPPCGSWAPFDFVPNPSGHFALADSDQVVCRVSAEAFGVPPGTVLSSVDIYAQWPDGTWRDLSLGGYALDAVRFVDHHCEFGTPPGHYLLRADIELPGGLSTTWAELWLDEPTATSPSTWGRVKSRHR